MHKSKKRILRRREKAVKFAARIMARREGEDIPYGWSLAVFFEQYMTVGSTGTRKDFGPKKPQKLKVVK